MSEENKPQEEAQVTAPEVVEIEWEEVQEVLSIREAMLDAEEQLSRWLLEVEKQKTKSLHRVNQLKRPYTQLAYNLETPRVFLAM